MTLTMFYDSSCILCRSEAMSLFNLANGNIRIIAVIDAQDELLQANISYQEAMTHLCVKDSLGNWYKGMDAVRVLYQVANIHILKINAFWLFNLPIIRSIMDFGYPYFANHRHLMPKFLVKLWYGVVYDVQLNQLCDSNTCYIH